MMMMLNAAAVKTLTFDFFNFFEMIIQRSFAFKMLIMFFFHDS